jgi:hypothetical protein
LSPGSSFLDDGSSLLITGSALLPQTVLCYFRQNSSEGFNLSAKFAAFALTVQSECFAGIEAIRRASGIVETPIRTVNSSLCVAGSPIASTGTFPTSGAASIDLQSAVAGFR